MDVESVCLEFSSAEFTTQVFTIYPETKLIGVVGLVLHAVVDVVVGDAGACAKWNLTAIVWKEVETVVMVMLHDGKVAM